MSKAVKTRFCPSPTGFIHLGNARTALFNYLFASGQPGGEFLYRVEDTDRERSKQEYIDALVEDLHWLGMVWQDGPYYQSERSPIYNEYYQKLIAQGDVYSCFCSEEELLLARKIQRASGQPPRYPGTCRHLTAAEIDAKLAQGLKPVLRFKVENDVVIEFEDLVRGPQKFYGKDIGDFIIKRSDGAESFMFVNAIDDALMGVNRAFRGEDHLTNTPRQILILQALGLTPPQYGHISLIVGDDGSPLSKRHGSRSIRELRAAGYLPLAVINYLARLGHYYENEQLLSAEALAQQFKLNSLVKSPAKFNPQQLDYWQKQVVLQLSLDEIWEWLGDEIKQQVPAELQNDFAKLMQENIVFPNEARAWLDVFFGKSLVLSEDATQVITAAGQMFFAIAADHFARGEDLASVLNVLKAELGIKGKALFQPLRVAVTGQLHGPEMVALFAMMPQELIVMRLRDAQAQCDY